jgi:hypothetical protein
MADKHQRQRFSRSTLRRTLAILSLGLAVVACLPKSRAVVPMTMQRTSGTPRDANVVLDEEYVGPLYLVMAQGLNLPVGKHRITVIKEGYFPWDRLVDADRKPVSLSVELVPIPE